MGNLRACGRTLVLCAHCRKNGEPYKMSVFHSAGKCLRVHWRCNKAYAKLHPQCPGCEEWYRLDMKVRSDALEGRKDTAAARRKLEIEDGDAPHLPTCPWAKEAKVIIKQGRGGSTWHIGVEGGPRLLPMSALNDDERRAVAELHDVAKRWPKTLWLFSGSSSLAIMKMGPNGQPVMNNMGCVDQNFRIDTPDVAIYNDGGDW